MRSFFVSVMCALTARAAVALHDCSAFAPSAPAHSTGSWRGMVSNNNTVRNGTIGGERNYEARLHACFLANPYDTSLLPVEADAIVTPFNIRFITVYFIMDIDY